jgi:hypothetical protein
MQPCNRIYYSNVHWRINMFRAAYHSSSGVPNCICSLWFTYACGEWELRLDYGRSQHAYVNQRLQIQLELLMMSGVPLETCWAFLNGGIINSITRLHLVGYFYWFILRCTDPRILNILIYTQQDATLHSLFYLETALHVSGGTTTHHQ